MPWRPATHQLACSAARPAEARPSAAKRGYNRRWRAYRAAYLREHPLCVVCLAAGKYVPGKHVNHTQAVNGPDDPRFWDPGNHRALCGSCHSRKTVRENHGFGR
jgi:5-methylcytosine-specific restriction endonuclease McrA